MRLFSVNCGWADWSSWGTCNPGTGTKERSRAKDPEALNGGADCSGAATESQNCPGECKEQ